MSHKKPESFTLGDCVFFSLPIAITFAILGMVYVMIGCEENLLCPLWYKKEMRITNLTLSNGSCGKCVQYDSDGVRFCHMWFYSSCLTLSGHLEYDGGSCEYALVPQSKIALPNITCSIGEECPVEQAYNYSIGQTLYKYFKPIGGACVVRENIADPFAILGVAFLALAGLMLIVSIVILIYNRYRVKPLPTKPEKSRAMQLSELLIRHRDGPVDSDILLEMITRADRRP